MSQIKLSTKFTIENSDESSQRPTTGVSAVSGIPGT